jgi:hypothetical protein
MNGAVEVQYHFWPWSVGDRKETADFVDGEIGVCFYGSPVLSVSQSASVYLARRYEEFIRFGPVFKAAGETYQLYHAPHGVISSREITKGGREECGTCNNCYQTTLGIKGKETATELFLSTWGGVESTFRTGEKDSESPLYRSVLRWSNFFDDCFEKARVAKRKGELPWAEIVDYIRSIAASKNEPRMALIVHISEAMRRHLPMAVHAARRILVRERRMLPAGRASETDPVCLRWYVRQPGMTAAQKASANRQRLLAVSRREFLDTLENIVLKDFLLRCRREAKRYRQFDVTGWQQETSKRALDVNSFGLICSDLHQSPHLEGVSAPLAAIRPNYVLQNDSRYRQIWKFYLRLLKQEDEEDRLWDWQSRTWADIGRLLVNAGLMSLCGQNGTNRKYILEEMLKSVFGILHEQHLGSRIVTGSEPGPFLVKPTQGGMNQAVVLEIVHSSQAGEHPATAGLGRIGGHLYLVLTPLDGGEQHIVVVWAVHTAACAPQIRPAWQDIGRSASRALKRHTLILEERMPRFPKLHGFVLASDLDASKPKLHPSDIGEVHLAQLPTDQEHWGASVDWVALIIEEILEQTI